NKDVVTKRTKIESQDQPIEADSEESTEDELKDIYNTPPPLSCVSSENESEEDFKLEDNDALYCDMKTVSFDDYLNQNKTESEWKLKDDRLIIDIVKIKTA
ncbi:17828_t:CDS:1, partial [Racocetra fulgida]